jgi:arylformamidase
VHSVAFHNMPDFGPMLLPGAGEYGRTMLALAREAARKSAPAFDLAYGEHPLQQLDIWLPTTVPTGGAPVVVLIHGGMYRNGHKEWLGAHAPVLAALPAVLVSPNYRLLPRARVPQSVEDAFQALAWVHANIARYGGNPRRLHLAGHSVGGHLAALLALDRNRLGASGIDPASIRSCLPISAPFTFLKRDLAADGFLLRMHGQLFESEEDAADVTAYRYLGAPSAPFFVVWGERDVPEIVLDNERFVRAAREHGCLRGQHILPGADHFEAHIECLPANSAWNAALRAFIAADP